jgi:aerobic carbon-monoxide dehydrogenase medium subunit
MIPMSFEFVRPSSFAEAFDALADPEARPIAGGHSLLPLMKLRVVQPGTLVDLAGLDLRGIVEEGGELRIGALTTYAELLATDPRSGLPDVLRECAASVGDLQVRNAGTIGGTLAHGDPASDFAPGALAVGARLRLRSPAGERELAASDFFLGPFTTALAPQEILTAVVVPRRVPGSGSAYVSFPDAASGYPLVGAAAVGAVDGRVSIGLCGIADRPLLADASFRLDGLDDYLAQLSRVAIDRATALARRRSSS